ncbi:hypothetical protein AVEN_242063-1 [Araneus ventricosus]|uniref:Uncharacterized protein n=1 Tax=Araneus ventricosus TaxID=182803 RepID=A0A4Y2SE86_ARAVE|nr:hypothetical protein AVEN_242063-1 [Araneus ventricosus]
MNTNSKSYRNSNYQKYASVHQEQQQKINSSETEIHSILSIAPFLARMLNPTSFISNDMRPPNPEKCCLNKCSVKHFTRKELGRILDASDSNSNKAAFIH